MKYGIMGGFIKFAFAKTAFDYIEKEEISEEKCYELLNNLEIIINNRWPK